MRSRSTPRSDAQKLTYASVAPATRSRMQAVRGRDTEPELRVRRALHGMGCRFRLQRKDLPGTPDIVLPRHRKIVLVHGCFWHGHEDCKRAKPPVNNASTWREKIRLNRERDQRNVAELRELGWDVLIIWECETRDPALLDRLLRSFMSR
ncbi:TPA: DNA mismatch endonuclease Vsr [Pseudomonas aeruginosa]|uniref:very short patch repair endonuclease n=2 Tax=Gammaproteobacteria TaxID=1236 RepID=UPI003A4D82F6|nr:DNA mismatch endonuclease Vsr [Pseudomonas aeruginosa]HBO8877139.1 DNA mismatch endonuclease Vsr [Pseudomonas aeruginosa]HBO8908655.1 DNA mismatch endonuclease Vsr [Pseudomonas aeruginosa]HBO8920355.1 DNA mismatch endonuclease Vsr [Pseudomonas aeruginosa]HBO8985937.1 DNA mismatch endonuclease Vsr [Pseudomonas aeruginosa]